jgi:prepilin-type N-terminal cleavage/methylation domain-containing protein
MDTNQKIQHRASSIEHRRAAHVGESLRDSHETLGCVLEQAGLKKSAKFSPHPRLEETRPRAGFTLIELLVVITIIGILVALLTVAAVGALKTARQTEIKTEINQMDTALMEYKNKTTAFPPNCQTDGPGTSNPLNESQIFADLKRHLKQAFPRHQESDDLIRVLCGIAAQNTTDYPQPLLGGMSAGEALVFWLGGFSSDPRYPISGEGGPSYPITSATAANNAALDPIESREWVFPFEVGRLAPRDSDGYFDPTDGRFIQYTARIKGQVQLRRINFWQYVPRNSQQPYLYFDTSRHDPTPEFDPPAATNAAGSIALHVHPLKKFSSAGAAWPFQFVEPEKFQVLHCGLDEAWDEEAFERMSYHGVKDLMLDPDELKNYLFFPTGPFIGEVADTIVNFTTETKLEDAQQ